MTGEGRLAHARSEPAWPTCACCGIRSAPGRRCEGPRHGVVVCPFTQRDDAGELVLAGGRLGDRPVEQDHDVAG